MAVEGPATSGAGVPVGGLVSSCPPALTRAWKSPRPQPGARALCCVRVTHLHRSYYKEESPNPTPDTARSHGADAAALGRATATTVPRFRGWRARPQRGDSPGRGRSSGPRGRGRPSALCPLRFFRSACDACGHDAPLGSAVTDFWPGPPTVLELAFTDVCGMGALCGRQNPAPPRRRGDGPLGPG